MVGQVNGLGSVHPFSVQTSSAHGLFIFDKEDEVVIRNLWTPEERANGRKVESRC